MNEKKKFVEPIVEIFEYDVVTYLSDSAPYEGGNTFGNLFKDSQGDGE